MVVALLVFAGIIPEGMLYIDFTQQVLIMLSAEHISVAIQDFLVCIEMVPFAIAHS